MKVIKSSIPEVMIMEQSPEEYVYKTVNETFALLPMLKNKLDVRFYSEGESFVEHSGTLCGIYYETGYDMQGKMIRCACGSIILCVVDMNANSPKFGRNLLIKVDDKNKRQVYIPAGFGFGFLTMTDNVFIQYKFEKQCPKECWNVTNALSEELKIKWPLPEKLAMAARDKYAPDLIVAKQYIIETERLLNSEELIFEGDDEEEYEFEEEYDAEEENEVEE